VEDIMEHKPLSEIQTVAYVTRGWGAAKKMSRRERLERWAMLLEQEPSRTLKPLVRVEFLPRREREMLRRDESPLTVAYADPVLRHEGLDSDCLGAAMDFFDLSDREAHYLLCDCHYHGGMTMTPDTVSKRIQGIASRLTMREVWTRVRAMF
jgi:hypothetical protein